MLIIKLICLYNESNQQRACCKGVNEKADNSARCKSLRDLRKSSKIQQNNQRKVQSDLYEESGQKLLENFGEFDLE